MNKKCVALTEEQYKQIIETIRNGFVVKEDNINDVCIKPNERIATALVLEANLGLRISDILNLHLTDILKDGDRYRLNIVERKTQKKREFTVPLEIYSYIQNYAINQNISPTAKLFDITERVVQHHLQLVTSYLGYKGISSHSFRKYFASSIYVNNGYNIELVRELLQHSSVTTTQRYIGIRQKDLENALQNHIKLV